MARRRYRLGRRAEAAEETRRRIVKATQALHVEQGIATTTMKQIAQRAGVGVGTVYHHFPRYEDAIQACGEYSLATTPPPTSEIFAHVEAVEERVERLSAAVFAWYDAAPGYLSVRADQFRIPMLRPFVEGEEQNRVAIMQEALAPWRVGERNAQVAAALLDLSVYRSLRQAGFGRGECAKRISEIIISWLGEIQA